MSFPFNPGFRAPANNITGSFGGIKPPILKSGRYIAPHYLFPSAYAVTTTAARYYMAAIYISYPTTFAGAWCHNSGAGDNGDKVKIAVYNVAAAGGPGTLAKSFGEVTLTGASAVRNFASSWTASAGWYYIELVTDNTVALYAMTGLVYASDVGYPFMNNLAFQIGSLATPTTGSAFATPTGDYVGGTYANFPEATSLTPTATIIDYPNNSTSFPAFGLYT